ncbi:MAG: hypothetical protein R2856_12870 [Caldilineaceae bacterium]
MQTKELILQAARISGLYKILLRKLRKMALRYHKKTRAKPAILINGYLQQQTTVGNVCFLKIRIVRLDGDWRAIICELVETNGWCYTRDQCRGERENMSEVSRICSQCGGSVALNARYCSHCGYDTSSGLPVQRTSLPLQVGKAALPVVAGLAGLALRSGWRFLQNQLAQTAASALNNQSRPTRPPVVKNQEPADRPRRTIRIQSSWVVGDGQGRWRQGQEEHIIEFDD